MADTICGPQLSILVVSPRVHSASSRDASRVHEASRNTAHHFPFGYLYLVEVFHVGYPAVQAQLPFRVVSLHLQAPVRRQCHAEPESQRYRADAYFFVRHHHQRR